MELWFHVGESDHLLSKSVLEQRVVTSALMADKLADPFPKLEKLEESPHLNPLNRALVVDEVMDRLIALVINENLRPGDKLPTERELMSRLAIGRSSLREAIKMLSAVGALEVKRGSGIVVGRGDTSILAKPLAWGLFLSRSSVGHVIEARGVIEPALAGWAAERRTADDLNVLEKLVGNLETHWNDKAAYIEYDLKFHLAIGRAAQNKILLLVLTIFQYMLRAWMEITYDETLGDKRPIAAHRKLFEAIRAQDSEAARKIMQAHISGAPLHRAMNRQHAESEVSMDFQSMLRQKL